MWNNTKITLLPGEALQNISRGWICEMHRIYCQPVSMYESNNNFFSLLVLQKFQTDGGESLISGGMLFQIFAPLEQIERIPYTSVFFSYYKIVTAGSTPGIIMYSRNLSSQ